MNDGAHQLPAGGNDRTRVTGPPATGSGDSATIITSSPRDDAHQGMGRGEAEVLPVGSRLAEFEITALVGQGGFGTVYEARDHALERIVAIKEYLPVSLCLRRSDGTVQPASQRQRETFELGMRSFINEARLLAQFDHPSLLKVYRFWQERGTAYMAMPLYRGPTLQQALTAIPGGAHESFLLRIVDDLTQALAVMHRADCYHRDIAPDNILLLEDSNRPVLLDFGAARRVITHKTQAITTILKPGYAPIEQYAEMPDTPQGAWTDVYALAAVLHVAVTGQTPPPSVARLLADGYVPLADNSQLLKHFSARLLAAIDAGLAVRPEARPQSIAAFRELLGLCEDPAAALPAPSSTAQRAESAIAPAVEKTSQAAPRGIGTYRAATVAVLALLVFAAGLGWWISRGTQLPGNTTGAQSKASADLPLTAQDIQEPPPQPPASQQTAEIPEAQSVSQAQPPENPASQTLEIPPSQVSIQEQTPQNPASQSTQVPPPLWNAEQQPPQNPASQTLEIPPLAAEVQTPQNPASQITTEAQPSPPPARPRTPVEYLAALAKGAASEFNVSATPRQQTVRIGKDKLGFEIRSSHAGYIYVYLLSANGELSLLFPNLLDKNNRIKANQTLALPRASWPITAGGPRGINHFAVLVSKYERNFAGSALRGNAIFPRFSLPNPAAPETEHGNQPSPLLGKPVCASGTACRDAYGVGMFEITEQ